jgi:hypothetical protein
VSLVKVLIVETQSCWIGLKKHCVTNGVRKVINKLRGDRHEVRREEEESFFAVGVDESEAIRVNHMKVFEVFQLLVSLVDDVFFFVGRREFRNLSETTVNVHRSCGFGCCE